MIQCCWRVKRLRWFEFEFDFTRTRRAGDTLLLIWLGSWPTTLDSHRLLFHQCSIILGFACSLFVKIMEPEDRGKRPASPLSSPPRSPSRSRTRISVDPTVYIPRDLSVSPALPRPYSEFPPPVGSNPSLGQDPLTYCPPHRRRIAISSLRSTAPAFSPQVAPSASQPHVPVGDPPLEPSPPQVCPQVGPSSSVPFVPVGEPLLEPRPQQVCPECGWVGISLPHHRGKGLCQRRQQARSHPAPVTDSLRDPPLHWRLLTRLGLG